MIPGIGMSNMMNGAKLGDKSESSGSFGGNNSSAFGGDKKFTGHTFNFGMSAGSGNNTGIKPVYLLAAAVAVVYLLGRK